MENNKHTQYILALLERYHEGQTSLREEQELAAYFRRESLPKELQPYKALFCFFQQEAAVMPPEQAPQAPKHASRKWLVRTLSLGAAAAALLISFFTFTGRTEASETLVCVYYVDGIASEDESQALALVQQQLSQISKKMHQAAKTMDNNMEQSYQYTKRINQYLPQ